MEVTLKRTFNDEKIKKILTDDELWQRIGDSFMDKEKFAPPMQDNIQYLEVFADNKCVGLVILTTLEKSMRIHVNILKPYRKTIGKRSGVEAIRLFLESGLDFLTTSIPKKFRDVHIYCLSFGFSGIEINGVHEMILTRKEAEKWAL